MQLWKKNYEITQRGINHDYYQHQVLIVFHFDDVCTCDPAIANTLSPDAPIEYNQ